MKVILLILDGWGYTSRKQGNAIAQANLPTIEHIEKNYPFCLLKASGISVGLPWAEPGNSEVGHLTLGAGRIILQTMPRIIQAIQDDSFYKNKALVEAVENARANDSQLHLMGLLGSGSVHSYIDHLYALLEMGQRNNISSNVRLHLFMDGKDSPPQAGARVLAHLATRLNKTGQGKIVSIIGRDYAMDRDYNWDRTKATVNLLIKGEGKRTTDFTKELEGYYKQGLKDNDIPATLLVEDDMAQGRISPRDSVIFFNFREDSARQLTKAFVLPERVEFDPEIPAGLVFVAMTEYDKNFPCQVAFKPFIITQTLAEVLSQYKKEQFRIAETQKYAHATYFFNGMTEEKNAGEEWHLVPSLDTSDFIKNPELKAPKITQELINALEKDRYDFFLANFANADVLAHIGDMEATIKACEALDDAIKEIMEALSRSSEEWTLIITADHGHAERLFDPISGQPLTEHTLNDVPCYFVSPLLKRQTSSLDITTRKQHTDGILSDIAPTVLELLDIKKPPEMTGTSLLSHFTSSKNMV